MCRATITISIGENGQPFEIIAVDEYNGNKAELFRIVLPMFQVGKFFCPLCGDEIVNAYPTAIHPGPDDSPNVFEFDAVDTLVENPVEPTTLVGLGPVACPCCDDGQDDGEGGCVCVEGCPNA